MSRQRVSKIYWPHIALILGQSQTMDDGINLPSFVSWNISQANN